MQKRLTPEDRDAISAILAEHLPPTPKPGRAQRLLWPLLSATALIATAYSSLTSAPAVTTASQINVLLYADPDSEIVDRLSAPDCPSDSILQVRLNDGMPLWLPCEPTPATGARF